MPAPGDQDFHAEERALAAKVIPDGGFDQYRIYVMSSLQRLESNFAVLSREVSDIHVEMKMAQLALAAVGTLETRVRANEQRLDRLERLDLSRTGMIRGGWVVMSAILGAGLALGGLLFKMFGK